LNNERCVGVTRIDDEGQTSQFFSRAKNIIDEKAIKRCPMYGVSAETVKQFIREKMNSEMEEKLSKIQDIEGIPKKTGTIEKIGQELRLSKMLGSVINHEVLRITDKKDSNNKKLFATQFFVEVTSEEQSNFWVKHSKEWQKHSNDNPDCEKLDWIQDNSGFAIQIGSVFSRNEIFPVWVNFRFAKIEGKQICFYNSTSMLIDYQMVEDFITTNFPIKYSNDRQAMTNSSNFHHCVEFCKTGE